MATIAYLAQGEIKILQAEGFPKTLESKFARSVRDRAIELHQRQGREASTRTGYLAAAGLSPDESP